MNHRFPVAIAALTIAACGGETSQDDPDVAVEEVGADTAADLTPDSVEDTEPDVDEAELLLGVEQTGGFELEGLLAPVQVVRTESDIPHIYAANTHDMYMAAGFVMARDRYIEFELGSRLSLGTLSELLGDITIDVDLESRGTGTAYVADRILENLSEEGLAVFQAYADGINAWQDALREGLVPEPSELSLLGTLAGVAEPTAILEPATPRSIAGFAVNFVFGSSHVFQDITRQLVADRVIDHFAEDAALYDLRAAGLIEDLWRPQDPVYEVPSTSGFRGDDNKDLRVPGVGTRITVADGMLERLSEIGARRDLALGRGTLGDNGSNVWAINDPNDPAAGTVVAGDGHLSLGIPPIFMQMGMDDVVFGGGETRQTGLFMPGFPLLGVGTNGHIAWSQTYPRADLTDFYAEQLELDGGAPARSLFQGEWQELVEIPEIFSVAGTLGAETTEVTHLRWTTFDGRWLVTIEGTEADGETEGAISVLGEWVIPGDIDEDGIVSAISMDYTAFDIGDMYSTVNGLGTATSVEEFAESTRGFVGYSQNLGVGDAAGSISLTSYTATPCRDYLERDAQGEWVEGAHPNRVLDGTRYGGFTVELDENKMPVEGAEDPYRCIIPFDSWPLAHNPASGYILNANQDLADFSFSGTLADQRWHIGGPWVPGFRANTIATRLEEAELTVEDSASIQGDRSSATGLLFAPALVDAIATVESWSADPGGSPAQVRAVELLTENQAGIEEAGERVEAWLAGGAIAASGVETFYNAPTELDRENAAATMIYNAWLRNFISLIFVDEDVLFAFEPASWARTVVTATLNRLLENRGTNPGGLASFNSETGESAFFDILGTEEVEISQEIAIMALVETLEELAAEQRRAGEGGFGTSEQSDWLWGLRHQVKFESILSGVAAGNPLIDLIAGDFSINTDRLPLAESFEDGDPRRGLEWFPRPGDLFGVDAANPSFFGDDYHHTDGPVFRMVIRLGPDGVSGQNIIPGGQSGITDSEHFDDQAALWLGNQTLPMRHTPAEVAAGATGREVLTPR